ncbi:CAAX protease [Aerosakkonemataceae cyanobacterium BLCC-F154]|uniref:CAAX protease n=1 Tax=Floridaenema fluviatile BLCC-F154 TaxID=3153640 RepID=A0ABV4YHP3_9CYAN
MTNQASGRSKKFWQLALVTGALIILLPFLPLLIQTAFAAMSVTVRLIFNLVGIGLVALLLAILLTPLEALGWWAGWYGDPIATTKENLGKLQEQAPTETTVSRYVIYLDGIGQANFDYLPDVERFLDDLAQVLPDDIQIIRGLMPYSPMNRALTENRPFAWFWNWADRVQSSGNGGLLAFAINLRNMFMVSVSADSRYGPIYNRGTAQVIYNSLLNHGYVPGSGLPITLIGFSGGGQISMGAAPYLKDALQAPIDIISIAGVFSGNNNSLKLEHFYHLVGNKDVVERAGPIFFPKRWKLLFLSYWNRTKRMGKVTLINLGAVGHQVPGGVMDADLLLADGRSALQQTVDSVADILQGTAALAEVHKPRVLSNLDRYREAAFNRPEFYPVPATVASDRYRPVANWIGRLILPTPEQRQSQSVPFEIHHAPQQYAHSIGKVVTLRWSEDPKVQAYLRQVTKDVHFSPTAEQKSQEGGVYPTRLNHWQLVDPLESLAGAHPEDDLIVALPDPVVVQELEGGSPIYLVISREPIQITGRFYGLVKFLGSVENSATPEHFRVVHFNKASQQFDGVEEVVWLPQVVKDDNDTYPFTNKGIEQSPVNETGWYIYGAPGKNGSFVVQAIAPRALFQLNATQEVVGKTAVETFLKKESWGKLNQQKGKISSTLLSYSSKSLKQVKNSWQEGSRALLVHVYGGIGGKKIEPAAQGPVYFGHFAFGVATVIREPLTDELRWDIIYHQIYTQNPDGLTSGSMHWSRYMGDRQFGWIGVRPISDTLIEFDPFTGNYEVAEGKERSPLDVLVRQLEVMAARYRIGDGTGGTYVGPANNCSQDSNQSLYAALVQMARSIRNHPDIASDIKAWMKQHPDRAQRLKQLEKLGKDLKWHLMPFGSARADWSEESAVLGSTLEDDPLKTLLRGLISWRTVLPRVASDSITECFLQQGATALMLRTNQLGGNDPDIAPLAPLTF